MLRISASALDLPCPSPNASGIDMGSPGFNANRRGFNQPYMPVNAGTLIPPALKIPGIHIHRDMIEHIAVLYKFSDIDLKGGVAAKNSDTADVR